MSVVQRILWQWFGCRESVSTETRAPDLFVAVPTYWRAKDDGHKDF